MTEITITQITCRRCNLTFPESCFHKSHNRPKGKTNVCKKCISVETKAIYARQKGISKTAPSEKQCSKCDEVKAIGFFDYRPTTKDGRNSMCKQCTSTNGVMYREQRRKTVTVAEKKQCSVCETVKPAKDFYTDRAYIDGLSKRCRLCHRATIHLARRCRQFNISVDQYTEMTRSQGGVCAICQRVPLRVHPNGFSIDHCHTTGVVRGLLCNHCNTGLGFFEDNPEVLIRAATYLNQHTNSSTGSGSVTTSAITLLNLA